MVPCTEANPTMRPCRFSIMIGAAAWIIVKWPLRWLSMTPSHSSSEMSANGLNGILPASRTRLSTVPYSSTAHCTTARPPATVDTSVPSKTATLPAATIASTNAAPLSPLTSLTTTRAPSAPSSGLIGPPRLPATPVTIATLSSSSPVIGPAFRKLVADRQFVGKVALRQITVKSHCGTACRARSPAA
jgi:hypothetical protein